MGYAADLERLDWYVHANDDDLEVAARSLGELHNGARRKVA